MNVCTYGYLVPITNLKFIFSITFRLRFFSKQSFRLATFFIDYFLSDLQSTLHVAAMDTFRMDAKFFFKKIENPLKILEIIL